MGQASDMTARRRRRWILVLAALGLSLAGIGVAAWLAFRAYAPLLAREQVEAALSRALDRPVRIEHVILHPWLRRVTLVDVTVAAGSDREPLLHLDRIATTIGISSLWRGEVVLSRILLDGPTLRVTGAGGEGAPQSLLVPDRFTAGPVTIRLRAIELRRGQIAYGDPAGQRGLEIQDLQATVRFGPRAIDLTTRVGGLSYRAPGGRQVVERLRGTARILGDRVLIREAAARWQGSNIRLRGEVRSPLSAPELHLSLKGEFDLAPLARLAGTPWPVIGVLSADGDIRGRLEAPEASGQITVPDLVAGPLRARRVAIRGRFADNLLRLDDIRAQVFGGQLRGSFSLPLARPDAMRTAFTLTSASIEALGVLAPAPPGLRGTVTLEAALRGDARKPGSLQGRTRIQASGVRLPGGLSRMGAGTVSIEATFRDAQLQVRHAAGQWPGIRTDLHGNLSPQGLAPLRLTLRADLAAVAAAWGRKDLAGQVRLTAEATGRWDDPEVAGRLEAPSIDLDDARVRDVQVPFRFAGRTLQTDSAALTLGQSRILASGSSTWGEGVAGTFEGLAQGLRFRVHLRAPAARLEDLARWMPPAWRGSGAFALSGSLEGTPVAWRGTGHVEARELIGPHGITIQGLRGVFTLDPDRIGIRELRGRVEGVPVALEGAYAWNGTGRASAKVGPADLAALPGLPERARPGGEGVADLEVTLRPGDVRGSGRVRLDGVWLSGIPVGDGTARLALQGRDFRATLAFPRFGLTGTAVGPLDQDGALDLRLLVKDLALAPLAGQALPENIPPVSGRVSAVAQATVPFRDPAAARMRLTLDPIRLSVEGEDWENRGPVVLRWEEGTLLVDQLQLASRWGSLIGGGRLDPSGEIELSLAGQFPLGLLPALWAEAREAGGRLEVSAKISGTAAAPRVTGEGAIREGRLLLAAYPETLRDVEARLLLSSSGLRLVEATGSLGRGQVRASGNLALDGWTVGAYQFTLAGQNVSVAPFEGLDSAWNLTLDLIGSGPRASLSGEARLVRGSYTGNLSLLSLLLARRTGAPAAPSPAILLRILLDLEDGLAVTTDLARLRAQGKLRLEGTAANPILFGTLEAHEGQIQFRKHRLALLSASARFDDPRRIDPVLDVRARGRIRAYDVNVELSGRSDELEVKLSSEPPLSREDLLALVTFGVTREGLARSGAGLFVGEAANLLIQDLLGVDTAGLGPEVLEVETAESGTRTIRVGKRLTDRTLVTYSQVLGDSGERKIRIEYELVGPLLIAGEQGFEGSYAADLLVRLRFR